VWTFDVPRAAPAARTPPRRYPSPMISGAKYWNFSIDNSGSLLEKNSKTED
jgi:hypothetical protein